MRDLASVVAVAAMLVALFTACDKAQQAPSAAPNTQAADAPAAAADVAAVGPATVGAAAPAWALKDLDGKQVSLSDFKDKKGVIMVFFATWCPACMEEVPELIKFQNAYKDRKVALFGIDLQDPERAVRRFMEEKKVNYGVLLDQDAAVAAQYGVQFIPYMVGIDSTGVIRYMDNPIPKDLDAFVKQLEPAAPAEKPAE